MDGEKVGTFVCRACTDMAHPCVVTIPWANSRTPEGLAGLIVCPHGESDPDFEVLR